MAYLLKQDLLQNKDITLSGLNDWRYCDVTFSADIEFCSEADIAFLRIDDGGSTTDSAAHTGDETRQRLSVTHTIGSCATKLEAIVYFNPTETMSIWVYDTSFSLDYYTRKTSGGCPCCGSFTYDPTRPSIQVPID